jgi:hypothetical protein
MFDTYYKNHLGKRLLSAKGVSDGEAVQGGLLRRAAPPSACSAPAQQAPVPATHRVHTLHALVRTWLLASRPRPIASTPSDLERTMMMKLKSECGYTYTQKMEAMYTDIRTSRCVCVCTCVFVHVCVCVSRGTKPASFVGL